MASFHHRIKSGKKGSAVEHSRYIERQGKSEYKEDLVHSGFGNLPAWAEGSVTKFWREADAHERKNGARYREHEIALPNELSLKANCALAERLVAELVGPKPYQFAVHMPVASLGDIPNPHLHLMFSDRMPDGIERSAKKMFGRFNAAHPELGGCRKDSGGKTPIELRWEVVGTRKKIADIQNEFLAAIGSPNRVDHRSLRDQGIEREPERHLGAARIKRMTPEEKAGITWRRNAG